MDQAGQVVGDVLKELESASSDTPLQSPANIAALDSCAEEASELIIRKRQASALGGVRALQTFTAERFVPDSEASRVALEAALAFNRDKDNLFFFGPTGTGKSHLAAVAARKYLGEFWKITTLTPMRLARRVRAAETAAAEQEIIEDAARSRVLVLDDVGLAKDTEFAVSLLYEVLHERYMNLPGGLIVTSNLSLDQLAEKLGDDRITSRLAGVCRVIRLVGEPDHRIDGDGELAREGG